MNGDKWDTDSPHPPVLPPEPDYDWLRIACLIVIALVAVGMAYYVDRY